MISLRRCCRMRVLIENVVLAGEGDGRRSRIGASVQDIQDESAMEAYSIRLVKKMQNTRALSRVVSME